MNIVSSENFISRRVETVEDDWESQKERVLARVARLNDPHRPLMSYIALPERNIIAVYHGDLDDSWWKRGVSRGERDVRKVENVVRAATGLQRITRIHIRQWVAFRIHQDRFKQAAVAVRLSFDQDEDYVEYGRKIINEYFERGTG